MMRSTWYAKFGRNIWVRISSRRRFSFSLYRYFYACTYKYQFVSDAFSICYFFFLLLIEGNCILAVMISFVLFYFSPFHPPIHRQRYLHNILLVVWMIMLETIIFYSEMLCIMSIAFFFYGRYGIEV